MENLQKKYKYIFMC